MENMEINYHLSKPADHLAGLGLKATSDGKDANPFKRSSALQRTPPSANKNPPKDQGGSVSSQPPESKEIETVDLSADITPTCPPRKVGTVNPKRNEEDMLRECKAILKTMKAATNKQRNISMGVKNGLAELEDLIDAITFNRERERTERGLGARNEAPVARIPIGAATTTAQKRTASSPLQRGTDAHKKRAAATPAEQVGEKKKTERDESPAAWNVVKPKTSRKKKNEEEGSQVSSQPKAPPKARERERKGKKPRNAALLIKPGEGRSYAEVLGAIRKSIRPEDTKTEIRSIRRTKQGEVLMELGAGTGDGTAFEGTVKELLEGAATVRKLVPKCCLEIKDLDCCTEKEEVEEALRRDFPALNEVKVFLTAANSRGHRLAIIEVDERASDQLLNQGRIKIGWLYCRVRRRITVARCFRCLGYGHVASTCNGPDRGNVCFKCGGVGHKGKACSAPESCVLCRERGVDQEGLSHVPGSGRCRTFREALEKTRKASR